MLVVFSFACWVRAADFTAAGGITALMPLRAADAGQRMQGPPRARKTRNACIEFAFPCHARLYPMDTPLRGVHVCVCVCEFSTTEQQQQHQRVALSLFSPPPI